MALEAQSGPTTAVRGSAPPWPVGSISPECMPQGQVAGPTQFISQWPPLGAPWLLWTGRGLPGMCRAYTQPFSVAGLWICRVCTLPGPVTFCLALCVHQTRTEHLLCARFCSRSWGE